MVFGPGRIGGAGKSMEQVPPRHAARDLWPQAAGRGGGTAGATLPSSSAIPLVCSNAGQDDGRTIGEFRDKGQFSPHGLDGLAQGGQQQIAALFESRNTVLGNAEGLGHSDLRELARVAQLAQGHLLGNQLSGAGLDRSEERRVGKECRSRWLPSTY